MSTTIVNDLAFYKHIGAYKLFHTHKESNMEDESQKIHPAVSAAETAAEGCS